MSIGILAYGSLIEEPGSELKDLVVKCIRGVETPFCVEFARKSGTRSDAPTLVIVDMDGAKVQGTILVLQEGVTEKHVTNMLWRRETRKKPTECYERPQAPDKDSVLVEKLTDFNGVNVVLYTKIAPNISDPTAEKLARLAIQSAKGKVGQEGKDGISYLISVKRQGIRTPLMASYERAILDQVGAQSLEEALSKLRLLP